MVVKCALQIGMVKTVIHIARFRVTGVEIMQFSILIEGSPNTLPEDTSSFYLLKDTKKAVLLFNLINVIDNVAHCCAIFLGNLGIKI